MLSAHVVVRGQPLARTHAGSSPRPQSTLARFEHMFYSLVMRSALTHAPATIWMVDDIPTRMVFAGRRWTVSDTPTRLRDSIWSARREPHRGLYGWRYQATDEDGRSLVFDVFKGEDGWHVHHSYE